VCRQGRNKNTIGHSNKLNIIRKEKFYNQVNALSLHLYAFAISGNFFCDLVLDTQLSSTSTLRKASDVH
jgi:hypothetical protein